MDTSPRTTAARHRALRGPAAALAAALLLAGCGGGTEPEEPAESPRATRDAGVMTSGPVTSEAPPAAAAEDVVIVIADFAYTVPETVAPGSTITVRNEDTVGHTVTSDEDGIFDVVAPPGEEVSFTVPEEAGEYPFHCTPHPNMTDTLVVG